MIICSCTAKNEKFIHKKTEELQGQGYSGRKLTLLVWKSMAEESADELNRCGTCRQDVCKLVREKEATT